MIVDSLETAIRKVDKVIALCVIAIPVLGVSEVQAGIIILDSILEVVHCRSLNGRLAIDRLWCINWSWNWNWSRNVGRNWGRPVDRCGSRSISTYWSRSISWFRCWGIGWFRGWCIGGLRCGSIGGLRCWGIDRFGAGA